MLTVDIQHACSDCAPPSDEEIHSWALAAIQAVKQNEAEWELSVRLVDPAEIQQLNREYRNKDKATNVLSFPCELPADVDVPLLGDLVICAAVVKQEAQAQQKPEPSHWAHMVVHGTLHLLGYDHIEDDEAEIMESLETQILVQLGFAEPYVERESLEH